MPNTRDINRRIKSVSNTRQITRAMEMVAATKMRRAQDAVGRSRAYAAKAGGLMTSASAAGDVIGQPLLAERPVKRVGIVTFTSDRGLAGAMNSNTIRRTWEAAAEQSAEVTHITVGKKAEGAVRRAGATLLASFTDLPDTPHYANVLPIAQVIIEEFVAGNLDKVLLTRPKFVSTLTNIPETSQLLPASPPEHGEAETTSALTLFEPSAEEVLESLLPRIIEIQLWQAMLETKASEHSSRMMAMRNATTNASDLMDELKLSFNQARQAAITTEIAEIAAAAG